MATYIKTTNTNDIEDIVNWIKKYFIENGSTDTKAVIGISGGKDSTVAAALLVRALGKDRVIGVLMPNGEQKDIDDALKVCEILDINYMTINIEQAVNGIYKAIDAGAGPFRSIGTKTAQIPGVATNTPARIRMTILYAIATMVHGRVCNTSNRSELYVGYSTKYGDLAGDFALFTRYTATEVVEIGHQLEELPSELVDKVPADGMCGKTDEENLGFTYKELDDYLLQNITPEYLTYCNIVERHNRNNHKTCVNLPCAPKYRSRGCF